MDIDLHITEENIWFNNMLGNQKIMTYKIIRFLFLLTQISRVIKDTIIIFK